MITHWYYQIGFFVSAFVISIFAQATDFNSYCRKSIHDKVSSKKRQAICWCVDDSYKSVLTSSERTWLMEHKNKKRDNASVNISDETIKRITDAEYNVFKNCTNNQYWRPNKDDLGVPDNT